MASIELGLGLLSIGRQWGVRQVPPPPREAGLELIGKAFEKGIRFFDTAPAYASSEAVLGEAISNGMLGGAVSTIATKMGEHWDPQRGITYVDHSYDALMRSVGNSLALLGRIDVLQLHKADAANVASADVLRAMDAARSRGVRSFGASVSDLETARIACETGRYEFLQFPFNPTATKLEAAFQLLADYDLRGIINRPFAMGALAGDQSAADHFRFILKRLTAGIILTGTSSSEHLAQNVAAFREAMH